MMDERSINDFLEKYAKDSYTDYEHQLFIDWLGSASTEQIQEVLAKYQALADIKNGKERNFDPKLLENIERKLDELEDENIPSKHTIWLWSKYKTHVSVAAIFLLICSYIVFFSSEQELRKPVVTKQCLKSHPVEISPGGNRAILTLANGKTIILDSARNGVLAIQSGLTARKTGEGQIVFDLSTKQAAHEKTKASNTITTPRGGQYSVILPDGSKVWLNAASSLKFPSFFNGKERIVDLNGEAYFEVSKSISSINGKNIPFRVRSGKHLVEVLGTHFNINAYPDEEAVTTTLLEGSVKVSQGKIRTSRLLKSGQQAKVSSSIQVTDVDALEAIAWKEGYFNFSHEDIRSIMRNISRWYDVDVEYKKNITAEKFVGSVSRYGNVSQVLDMLQLTGSVHFKIEGRRITVMP